MTFVTFDAPYIMGFVLPRCAPVLLHGIAAGQSRSLSVTLHRLAVVTFREKAHHSPISTLFSTMPPLKRQKDLAGNR